MRSRPSAIVALLVLVAFGCADPPAPADPSVLSAKALADVAAAYGIEIVAAAPVFPVRTVWGKIDGKEAGRDDLERYVPLFAREFSLYPPALVKRTKLKRVVLCAGLSFAGQRRNAIPDFEHDTLYLDAARGWHSPRYLCTVIHHEFFHVIDYRDDGSLYADERWSALNPAGFKYGTGGKTAQDRPTTSELTDESPGFLTHYATTGVEEDKAEVFAHLIVNAAAVERRAKAEPVLAAKVTRLKELLVAFCPEANEAFWTKATATERPGK